MKARVLKRLLNDTGYSVAEYENYIAVGSPLCHDLISVDKDTLKVKYALDTFNTGRKAISSEELKEIWDKLHALIASGEIQDIIEGCDVIDNPLPVYTVEDGLLIETTTDEYGWPNVTVDGKMMHDNTYFKTRDEALAKGIDEVLYGIGFTDTHIIEAETRLAEVKERRVIYSRQLNDLKKLQEDLGIAIVE